MFAGLNYFNSKSVKNNPLMNIIVAMIGHEGFICDTQTRLQE